MSIRLFRWAAALALVLVVSAASQAQQTGTAPRIGSPEDTIEQLKARVEALEARMATLEKTTVPAVELSLSNILDRLEALQNNDLPALRQDVTIVNDKLSEITESDGVRTIPSILGNMQKSDKFRDQVVGATQAKLLVDNRTGISQTLHVNGTPWNIPPGASSIDVQYGSLTTQLTYYEPVKQWEPEQFKLDGERYQLKMVIGY